MRKIGLVLCLVLLPALAGAFPVTFLNIENASLQRLDEDSFRLRVTVDYGPWLSFADLNDLSPLDPSYGAYVLGGMPYLQDFSLQMGTELGTPDPDFTYYNYFTNNPFSVESQTNGQWIAFDHLMSGLSLGDEFGFDFDYTGDPTEVFSMVWGGTVGWYTEIDVLSLRSSTLGTVLTQDFTGAMSLYAIPEPGALALFGLGLLVLGIRARRARK